MPHVFWHVDMWLRLYALLREHRDRDSGERQSKGRRRKEHSLWSCASHLASQMLFSKCMRTLAVSTSLAWWWAVGITSQNLGQLLNQVSKWVTERVECFSLKRSESWGKEKKTFSKREDKKFKKKSLRRFLWERVRADTLTWQIWLGKEMVKRILRAFYFLCVTPPPWHFCKVCNEYMNYLPIIFDCHGVTLAVTPCCVWTTKLSSF